MSSGVDSSIVYEHSYALSDPAKPLHHQQIERALCLTPLINQVEIIFDQRTWSEIEDRSEVTDTEDEKSHYDTDGNKTVNGIVTTKSERRADKTRLYNFTRIKKNRRWLRAILLSDSSSDEDDEPYTKERLHEMLKIRKLERKYQAQFYQNPEQREYQYYGSGLLSYNDRYPDQQRLLHGPKKKNGKDMKKMDKKVLKAKLKKLKKNKLKEMTNRKLAEGMSPEVLKEYLEHSHQMKERANRVKKLTPEQIVAKRKKIWHTIAKKEIPKAYKQKASARKEMLSMAKKLAHQCMKESRRSAIQSQKNMRETPLRARRLTREMMTYWKRFEKVEKEHRKRVHKEAQEQRKLDLNLLEARRQQRKLNFLITQTELYAHFMSRKMTGATEADKEAILSRLEEDPLQGERQVDGGLLTYDLEDDYDETQIKSVALQNAEDALAKQHQVTQAYDTEFAKTPPSSTALSGYSSFANPAISTEADQPQPSIFEGKLKGYQLKGMNWLVNLYNQGINGILADEMGLGKTIQSMALLAHLAENLGIWGPFLVVAPASTLHNWQQECARFIPKLKVVPYWGNTQDRRILRKFWNQSHLHTAEASFHVIITSYQLVIQDVKYFQRIKWQYMVLDEAQALKSSSSARWKTLLGFSCRNRLLLTGTPIQNSMAELWALLHFIMPTLFDSHEEFNEWFSKDIESHAEKQSGIDENQLSRLHMILKPFMLRRVKKDVENELSDKIEVLVFCPLTTRQRYLYQAIKNKIRIEDLLQSSNNASQAQNSTSSLMNLVMQFRKVCNHPELFERREIRSPFHLQQELFLIPKLIYRDGTLSKALPSKRRLLENVFCVHRADHIHRSTYPTDEGDTGTSRCFSFLRFINISPGEMESIMLAGLLVRWLAVFLWLKEAYRIHHHHTWQEVDEIKYRYCTNREFLLAPQRTTYFANITTSDNLRHLVFASHTSTFHTHTDHVFHSIPETIGHRKIRQKHIRAKLLKSLPLSPTKSSSGKKGLPLSPVKKLSSSHQSSELALELAPQHPHVERDPVTFECQPTHLPPHLYYSVPKVMCRSRDWHASDRSAMWDNMRDSLCGSLDAWKSLLYGLPETAEVIRWSRPCFYLPSIGGIYGSASKHGFSNVYTPDKEILVTDAGKLHVLDSLLARLKDEGHRVLIYSQMTRMIDLLEEYMWHRKHTYMRLDGSSKISDRRDMVADFQSRSDIFVFLLSTRAGGLGINLTAADTVIFYDSDWNPTVDQQAMDRAHRLGQTKQVTVYRLICKGTIEERILQRAREKSEIQRMVISGGNFRPDTLKPKEVVSLLIDDDEMEKKLKAKQEEKKVKEEVNKSKDRKRKKESYTPRGRGRGKRAKVSEVNLTIPADEASIESSGVSVPSPESSVVSFGSEATTSQFAMDENSNDGGLVIVDEPAGAPPATTPPAKPVRGRGRPKGSGGMGRRPRGRGRVQKAISAAEIAGAQAGMTAAYAAFGYNFKGMQPTSPAVSPPKVASTTTPRSPRSSRHKSGT